MGGPFGPFSEGTMMLHAATARAGVGGVGWLSVGSNQAQFRPRTRRGWIAACEQRKPPILLSQ
jgi:hypothetical protein